MANAEKMIQSLLKRPSLCQSTGIANDIVAALYESDSLNLLDPLLESENIILLRTGIWIISELGENSVPFLPKIIKYLSHSDPYIRYYVLDAIQACNAVMFNDDILNCVRNTLNDEDMSIREKSQQIVGMNFCNACPIEQRLVANGRC